MKYLGLIIGLLFFSLAFLTIPPFISGLMFNRFFALSYYLLDILVYVFLGFYIIILGFRLSKSIKNK